MSSDPEPRAKPNSKMNQFGAALGVLRFRARFPATTAFKLQRPRPVRDADVRLKPAKQATKGSAHISKHGRDDP